MRRIELPRMNHPPHLHRSRPAPSGHTPACAEPALDVGVIYTYERQLLDRLLATMKPLDDPHATRLVLIDNASDDGVERWHGALARITTLRNSTRRHYSANLNRIVAASTARYVLLLNTDVYFDPTEPCLAKMVAFMDSHPDCGIASCGIYHADGKFAHPARRYQTPRVIAARRTPLGRWMGRTLDDYFYRERPIDGTWPCDWISGCFMMVRRAAFDAVGPFDAGFAKYFEDVDICARMTHGGWRVMYHGATWCYHLESRSSRYPFSAAALTHLRSYARWVRRWGLTGPVAQPEFASVEPAPPLTKAA